MQRPQNGSKRGVVHDLRRLGAVQSVGELVECSLLVCACLQSRFSALALLSASLQRLRSGRKGADGFVILEDTGRSRANGLLCGHGLGRVVQHLGAGIESVGDQPGEHKSEADAAQTRGQQQPQGSPQRRSENALPDADANRPAV